MKSLRRVGWHWTSEENWAAIQADGAMREYPLNKIEVSTILMDTEGIFVFPDSPLDDWDEMGCVLFHMLTKRTHRAVLLHIDYADADVKVPPSSYYVPERGDIFELTHNGDLGDGWNYHRAKTMSVLKGPISTDRVTLVKTYDMHDLLTHARKPGPQTGPTADADHLLVG